MEDISSTCLVQSPWTDVSTVSERALLKNRYPSKAFAAKVDKMSDAQVIAILRRLQRENKL
jgi:hypothetical protein